VDITNENQLLNLMRERTNLALTKASKEVLEIFKEKYIMEFAYIDDPKKYERTWEFKNAWTFTDVKEETLRLLTELWYDSSKIKTFDLEADAPYKYIHGSQYSTPNYVGANLPAVLEGKKSKLWLSVNRNVNFWEKFIEDMFSGGELDRILTKHFLAAGFART